MAEKLNGYANAEIIGFLPKAKEFNLFKRSDNYPFYKAFKFLRKPFQPSILQILIIIIM